MAQRQKERLDDQHEQDRKPAVHLADKLVPFHLSFLPFVSRSARAVRRVRSGSAASRAWRHHRRVSGDRKSVVSGKSASVRVDIGGSRFIKQQQTRTTKPTVSFIEKIYL